MLKIYKLRLGDTFDHAAQELKKYLRMMNSYGSQSYVYGER